jgi:hypothetical protein
MKLLHDTSPHFKSVWFLHTYIKVNWKQFLVMRETNQSSSRKFEAILSDEKKLTNQVVKVSTTIK